MKNKSFLLLILIAVCFCVFIMPTGNIAYANSALKYWEGVTGFGALVTDDNVPIVVEKETITFDIKEFPNIQHDDNVFQSYQSKVTAEYNFYNPSEYNVTATLVFPYGNNPMYSYVKPSDDKYGIKIDGEIVDSKIRHTYHDHYSYYDFDYTKAVPKILDDYVTDTFYLPELPVYKHTYEVSDLSLGNCVATFTLPNAFDVRYHLVGGSSKEVGPDGSKTLSYGTWVKPNDTVVLYVIGKDVEISNYAFYENYRHDATRCSGTFTLKSKETLTFKDLALLNYDDDSDVLEVDYYNAVVDMLNSGRDFNINMNDYLMGWYQYDINVPAGGRVINTVTAPLYPNINNSYDPPKYDYNYYLSPAKSWAGFGELTININTTAYMLDNTLEGFEKVDTGYRLQRNGLPNDELTFTLCEDEKPKKEINWGYYLIIIIPIAILVALVAIIVTIVIVVKKKRKKKNMNRKD